MPYCTTASSFLLVSTISASLILSVYRALFAFTFYSIAVVILAILASASAVLAERLLISSAQFDIFFTFY